MALDMINSEVDFCKEGSEANLKRLPISEAEAHGVLKHMASVMVPPIFDATLADARVGVATEEAQEMTRRLAREEGLLVGLSSGAAVVAALRAGREAEARTVAVILPDGGERYLSDVFWEAK